VVHRHGHPVVHLAALGLDPDLFKNVNTEAFVAGICFVIQRLDLLKLTALSVVLSAEASGQPGQPGQAELPLEPEVHACENWVC